MNELVQIMRDSEMGRMPLRNVSTEVLKGAILQYRRGHATIGDRMCEDEALAQFYLNGWVHNETTWGAHQRMEAERLDRQHNVIKHPDAFRGWHIASAEVHKPGSFKFVRTRATSRGYEMEHGYCSQDVLRVAIEQHLCTKPNGFVLAN